MRGCQAVVTVVEFQEYRCHRRKVKGTDFCKLHQPVFNGLTLAQIRDCVRQLRGLPRIIRWRCKVPAERVKELLGEDND